MGWGYSSVVDCSPTMYKALGSIPSIAGTSCTGGQTKYNSRGSSGPMFWPCHNLDSLEPIALHHLFLLPWWHCSGRWLPGLAA